MKRKRERERESERVRKVQGFYMKRGSNGKCFGSECGTNGEIMTQ